MAILPEAPRGFWDDFAPIFAGPTFRRFLTLIGAAILTVGRRTIANLLRTAGSLAAGTSYGYRRVFSKARWSPLRLARVLARRVVVLLPDDAEVALVADDTVFSHPGRRGSSARPSIVTRPTTAANGGGIARRPSRRSDSG
jgi:hypothetical protein